MPQETQRDRQTEFEAVRREFPLTVRRTYLNTAANGLVPECSRRVMERYFREYHYVAGMEPFDPAEVLDTTRQEVARLLECDPACVALTFNTSHGLNLAAHSIDWREGDNVVLTRGEFPANVYPWRALERLGVETRMVETPERRAEVGALLEACDARTRAVAIAAVQFHDGFRPDLAALAAACRPRGIRTVVDATQAAGICALRPATLGVDFLAAGGQKWLMAPRGSGFLYIRRELLATLPVPWLGWLNVDYGGRFDNLLEYPRELFADARRYELGTPNLHDILALRESLRLLNGLGIEAVEAHGAGLAEAARRGLEACAGIQVVPAGPQPSAIVAFRAEDDGRVEDLQHRFDAADVDVAYREGRFRASFHLYNRSADVDRLLDVVR